MGTTRHGRPSGFFPAPRIRSPAASAEPPDSRIAPAWPIAGAVLDSSRMRAGASPPAPLKSPPTTSTAWSGACEARVFRPAASPACRNTGASRMIGRGFRHDTPLGHGGRRAGAVERRRRDRCGRRDDLLLGGRADRVGCHLLLQPLEHPVCEIHDGQVTGRRLRADATFERLHGRFRVGDRSVPDGARDRDLPRRGVGDGSPSGAFAASA